MAYEGETLLSCPPASFFVGGVDVVVVSGASWNPCGHMLLHAGGRYFHVAGQINDYPKTMDQTGYERYLRENWKRELRRTRVPISNPDGAMRKVQELLNGRWFWGGLPNNCAHFAEVVVAAGGSNAGLYSNCPTREAFR